jgi:hypothetical protein
MVELVAGPMEANPAEMQTYPAWAETRREHWVWLQKVFPYRPYGPSYCGSLTEALATDSAFTWVQLAMEWLRERRVMQAALTALESMRSVRSLVERQVYWRLANGLGLGRPKRGSLRSCSIWGRRREKLAGLAAPRGRAPARRRASSISSSGGVGSGIRECPLIWPKEFPVPPVNGGEHTCQHPRVVPEHVEEVQSYAPSNEPLQLLGSRRKSSCALGWQRRSPAKHR